MMKNNQEEQDCPDIRINDGDGQSGHLDRPIKDLVVDEHRDGADGPKAEVPLVTPPVEDGDVDGKTSMPLETGQRKFMASQIVSPSPLEQAATSGLKPLIDGDTVVPTVSRCPTTPVKPLVHDQPSPLAPLIVDTSTARSGSPSTANCGKKPLTQQSSSSNPITTRISNTQPARRSPVLRTLAAAPGPAVTMSSGRMPSTFPSRSTTTIKSTLMPTKSSSGPVSSATTSTTTTTRKPVGIAVARQRTPGGTNVAGNANLISPPNIRIPSSTATSSVLTQSVSPSPGHFRVSPASSPGVRKSSGSSPVSKASPTVSPVPTTVTTSVTKTRTSPTSFINLVQQQRTTSTTTSTVTNNNTNNLTSNVPSTNAIVQSRNHQTSSQSPSMAARQPAVGAAPPKSSASFFRPWELPGPSNVPPSHPAPFPQDLSMKPASISSPAGSVSKATISQPSTSTMSNKVTCNISMNQQPSILKSQTPQQQSSSCNNQQFSVCHESAAKSIDTMECIKRKSMSDAIDTTIESVIATANRKESKKSIKVSNVTVSKKEPVMIKDNDNNLTNRPMAAQGHESVPGSVLISRDRAQLALNAILTSPMSKPPSSDVSMPSGKEAIKKQSPKKKLAPSELVSSPSKKLPTLKLKLKPDGTRDEKSKKVSKKKSEEKLLSPSYYCVQNQESVEQVSKKLPVKMSPKKSSDLNNNKGTSNKKAVNKKELVPCPMASDPPSIQVDTIEGVQLNPESLKSFIDSRGYQQLLLHLDEELDQDGKKLPSPSFGHGSSVSLSSCSRSPGQFSGGQTHFPGNVQVMRMANECIKRESGLSDHEDESKLPAKKRKRNRSSCTEDEEDKKNIVLDPYNFDDTEDNDNFGSSSDLLSLTKKVPKVLATSEPSPPLKLTLSLSPKEQQPKKKKKKRDKESSENGSDGDQRSAMAPHQHHHHKHHHKHKVASDGSASDSKGKEKKEKKKMKKEEKKLLKKKVFSIKSCSTVDTSSAVTKDADGHKVDTVDEHGKKIKKEKKELKKEIKKEVKEEKKEKKRNESESSILNELNFIRRSERIFIHDSIICNIPVLANASATTDVPSDVQHKPSGASKPSSIKKRRRSSEAGSSKLVIRRSSSSTIVTTPTRKVSFDDSANREPLRLEQLELTDHDLDKIQGTNQAVRIVLKNPEDGNLYTASVRSNPGSSTKFEITLDGSRTRTLVLDREHLKKNSVMELVPRSFADFVPFAYDRTLESSPRKKKVSREERNEEKLVRVCAFWSGQVRILYTGTVGISKDQTEKSDLDRDQAEEDESMAFVDSRGEVLIEFDDGDFARIPLSDTRILKKDFMDTDTLPPGGTAGSRKGSRKRKELKSKSPAKVRPGTEPLVSPSFWTCDETSIIKNKNTKKEFFTRIHRVRVTSAGGSEKDDDGRSKRKKKRKHEVLKVGDAAIFFQETHQLSTRPVVISSSSSSASSSRRSSLSSQEESVGKSGLKDDEDEDDDEPMYQPSPVKKPKKESGRKDKVDSEEDDDEEDDDESGLPFVGRIDSFWRMKGSCNDSPGPGQMKVKVRWFYHASEAGLENTLCVWSQRALFESLTHTDINDVQSIKKKCRLLPFTEFVDKMNQVRRKERNQPAVSSPTKSSTGGTSPVKSSIKDSISSTGSVNPVKDGDGDNVSEPNPDVPKEERRSSRRGAMSLGSGKSGRNWYYLAGTFEPLSRQVKYDPQVPLI